MTLQNNKITNSNLLLLPFQRKSPSLFVLNKYATYVNNIGFTNGFTIVTSIESNMLEKVLDIIIRVFPGTRD